MDNSTAKYLTEKDDSESAPFLTEYLSAAPFIYETDNSTDASFLDDTDTSYTASFITEFNYSSTAPSFVTENNYSTASILPHIKESNYSSIISLISQIKSSTISSISNEESYSSVVSFFTETNDSFSTPFPTEINSTHSINGTGTGKSHLYKYYPFLAAELGLSILCSIILIIVYIIIKEHRTLPGKNIISISVCLIITYVLLMIDLLMRNRIPHDICVGIGITVQTTFIATFFWTNVMSYDIMKTMASIKPDSERTSKYWTYFAYSSFMTLLCVAPAVIIDQLDFVPKVYKPNFGVKKCWMSGQVAFLIYLNAPVGLTLVANCVFFYLSARTIVKVRNATAILEANRHKKRFRLCMKLVLIMGLVWITEFIPWITGIYYLYAIAGMLNCLHGVYLFLIFVCKRRTLKAIAENCSCSKIVPPFTKKKTPSLDTVTTMVASA